MNSGGQQAVDIIALFLAPFFSVIIAFALATFSPLGKIPGWKRYVLLGCISISVAAGVLACVSLLGAVSVGIKNFDLVAAFVGGVLASFSRFWSTETITDKKKDERIHKQDSGWF